MKKLILFIFFVIILIGTYLFISNKPKSYEISYDKNGLKVLEKYDINRDLYSFYIKTEKMDFDYAVDKNYTKDRKIIDDINVRYENDYICVSIVIDKVEYPTICSNGKEYVDSYIAGIKETNEQKKLSTYNGIEIYNKDYDFLLWNGYGLTDLINKKEYNFLKNESYDNNLAYKYDNIIIFADYDASREFNKFYIFDNDTKKINEWKIDYSISTSSYFMGDVDGNVYLFDKKNKVQYKLNINKRDIEISSDENGALFYDMGWTTNTLNKLSYNELQFIIDDLYQYSIIGNKLNYNYVESNKYIKISQRDVIDIIDYNDDTVYYLSEDALYSYNIYDGEKLLLKYFEWNFSYKNKIFIFD